jgi:hypothetical protein
MIFNFYIIKKKHFKRFSRPTTNRLTTHAFRKRWSKLYKLPCLVFFVYMFALFCCFVCLVSASCSNRIGTEKHLRFPLDRGVGGPPRGCLNVVQKGRLHAPPDI